MTTDLIADIQRRVDLGNQRHDQAGRPPVDNTDCGCGGGYPCCDPDGSTR